MDIDEVPLLPSLKKESTPGEGMVRKRRLPRTKIQSSSIAEDIDKDIYSARDSVTNMDMDISMEMEQDLGSPTLANIPILTDTSATISNNDSSMNTDQSDSSNDGFSSDSFSSSTRRYRLVSNRKRTMNSESTPRTPQPAGKPDPQPISKSQSKEDRQISERWTQEQIASRNERENLRLLLREQAKKEQAKKRVDYDQISDVGLSQMKH